MTDKKRRSLSDVVKERREAEECMLCVVPERKEIERERREGADIKDIAAWLIKDCGYSEERVTKQRSSKMSKHFSNHMENAHG